MRAIDRLTAQFPAPRSAIERGIEEKWVDVQSEIGSVLPRDYKDFINAYGSTYLCRFLRINNPFSERPFVNFFHQVAQTLSAFRELKAQWGDEACPYALWFEPDSLLPWGITDNGDTLFWLTKGHPDQWTVVVNKRGGSPGFETYDGSMVEFVLAFLTRSFDKRIQRVFPDDSDHEPTIEPLGG